MEPTSCLMCKFRNDTHIYKFRNDMLMHDERLL